MRDFQKVLLSPDADSAGGDSNGVTPTPNNSGGDNSDGGGNQPGGLTQADVDRILKDRVARAERSAREKALAELKAKGVLIDESELEEIQKLRAERLKAQEEEERQNGHFKTLYERAQKEREQREAELARKVTETEKKFRDTLLSNALGEGLFGPEAPKFRQDIQLSEIKQLVLASGAVRYDEESGEIRVFDTDGNPRYSRREGKQSLPMSVGEYVAEWADSHPWAVAASGAAGPGGGLGGGSRVRVPANALESREAFSQLSPEQKQAAFAQAGLSGSGNEPFFKVQPHKS